MLLDANILLYAVNRQSGRHELAAEWLISVLHGRRRVGIPWQCIGAFLRISTHPRVNLVPLTTEKAWEYVRRWLECDTVWIPPATERTAAVYGELSIRYGITANLVPDAMLAALALEYGLTIYSADTDFARFTEVRWENPVAV